MTRHNLVEDELRVALRADPPMLADPDVGRAMRTGRRQRRLRVSARVGAVAAAAAAVALGAGTMLGGPGERSGTTPADGGRVREVMAWSGETVAFRGVTVPVPDGWVVQRTASTEEGGCAVAAPRTIWVVEAPAFGTPACMIPTAAQDLEQRRDIVWVLHDTSRSPIFDASQSGPLEIDPSGQPVWQSSGPHSAATISFPWRAVMVRTSSPNTTVEQREILMGVRADPVAAQPGLNVPSESDFVWYSRFGSTATRGAPDAEGTPDADAVVQILVGARPAEALTCVPAVGAEIDLQAPGPEPVVTRIVFDTTGTCPLVFDSFGGLATLEPNELEALRRHVLVPN